jgi:catechol 2,3-dioxygenase-like lactoylglutathione lyase family enzyme
VDRPSASIALLTYEDLPTGIYFYGETLGLPLVEDQGWAKVYQIGGTAYVGIVKARRGSVERPVGSGVLLSIIVDTVEAVDTWHERLRSEPEIEISSEPARVPGIPVYSFFLRDPAGYAIEIQAFTELATADRFRNGA